MTERRIRGYCALCKAHCGAVAVVDGDRLLRVEPDPDHPTGAALCIKGRSSPEIRASPNRVLYPQLRTAPKGAADPGWRRIGWDEALDRTASAMRAIAERHGPEAVAFALASPAATPISDGYVRIKRLINRFGSPNVCNAVELCNWFLDYSHRLTFGRGIGSPDFARSRTIVLWGYNPSVSGLDHATALASAMRRNVTLIVVDPRRAGFAGRADAWLRVRPGADAALALSLTGEMIHRDLLDASFVRRWTNGPLLVREDTNRLLRGDELDPHLPPSTLVAWDEVAGRPSPYDTRRAAYADPSCRPAILGAWSVPLASGPVACTTVLEALRRRCAAYPPEVAATITGVPAEEIRRAATLLGEQRPVSYYAWTGIAQHANSTQTDRAIAVLMALTGSVDSPGGNVEYASAPVAPVKGEELVPGGRRSAIGSAGRPLGPAGLGVGVPAADLYRAVLERQPYGVHALVAFGSNLLLTRADPERGAAALKALELYVHADPVPNPSSAFADILLPVSDPWEREGLNVGFDGSEEAAALVQLRPRAVPPAGESRSDTWIVFQLAERLEFGADFWDGDVEAAHDHLLSPSRLTMADLRARPGGIAVPVVQRRKRHAEQSGDSFCGFDTPSRLVELHSERMVAAGYDPLPDHRPTATDPRHPLLLTNAKLLHFCQSQHRDIPALRRHAPEPVLELHPSTAADRGIADGVWVEVRTAHGRARFRAKLNSSLDPSVVSGHFGWWRVGPEPELANFAALIDPDAADPISGTATHRGLPCEVEPATRSKEEAPEFSRTGVR